MSIDIQKQINFRAQNNNIINAPQQFSNEPKEQPVDEEKSNAAKWMIGLTATAAIVIGGIWAAKKGHLGESAQKYANKLLGNASDSKPKGTSTDSASSTSTPASTSSATSSTSTNTSAAFTATSTAGTAVALLARKNIRKIIKAPKNITDTIQNFQSAGVAFERTGNDLIVKIGDDIARLGFDDTGSLIKIIKPAQKEYSEIMEFNAGKLKNITRKFNIEKGLKEPLQQKIEFDDAGKLIKEVWSVKQDTPYILQIERRGKNYYSNNLHDLRRFFAENFDELPTKLKKAKIYESKDIGSDQGAYLTARVAKYWDRPISEIPKEIPTHELVRQTKSLNYIEQYDNLFNKVELARNAASRCNDGNIIYNDTLANTLLAKGNLELKSKSKEEVLEEIVDIMGGGDTGTKRAKICLRMLEEDLGSATSFTNDSYKSVLNYMKKFKTYGLDKNSELMEIAVKPLNECSYAEMNKILEIVNPKKANGVVKDDISRSEETRLIIKRLSEISGLPNINENTKIFDILKDIS